MIIDTLPYFLMLVKKNVIIHTLVATSSFNNIDFKGLNHEVIGKALRITNFALSEEDIVNVDFYVSTDPSSKKKGKITSIIFTTNESKYFDNSMYYFNDDENKGKNRHPIVREQM